MLSVACTQLLGSLHHPEAASEDGPKADKGWPTSTVPASLEGSEPTVGMESWDKSLGWLHELPLAVALLFIVP